MESFPAIEIVCQPACAERWAWNEIAGIINAELAGTDRDDGDAECSSFTPWNYDRALVLARAG